MARRANNIQFAADFSGVAALIGAVSGASGVGRKDRYIGKLITAAHARVSDEFNMQIAADAAASGTLNHMYEWGTAGINPGRGRRLNPLSQEARLWKHVLVGAGKSKGIAYDFLPSKMSVPPPTTRKTGISQKYLSKLKSKSVFWNKAFVMETGATVNIRPKRSGRLFIPLNNNTSSAAADIKRGFVMTRKPVTARPGGAHIGTFDAYWEKFWNGEGEEGMRAHMETSFREDLERIINKTDKVMHSPKPVEANRFNEDVKKYEAQAEASMMSAAEARAKKRIHD